VPGATVKDIKGNNDGTTSGTIATGVAGMINEAFDFDGVNDYVSLNQPSLDSTVPVSTVAWIKKDVGNQGCIWRSGSTGMGFHYGPFRAYVDGVDTGWTNQTSYPDDGNWHHVGFTYDLSVLALYIDGTLEETFDIGVTNLALGTTAIGSNQAAGTPDYFNGKIDEVCLYNRALSDFEIRRLYRETRSNKLGRGFPGWP